MLLNQNLKSTSCLNCRNTVDLTAGDSTLTCPECSYGYTVIDQIPMLVKDAGQNLAASWMQHKALIEENMVLMVEPGSYVPRLGGVRCEFMLRVTRSGAEAMATF